MSEPVDINAVNAWYDDEENAVILAMRPKGNGAREHSEVFQEYRIPIVEADQIVSMLYSLTKNRIATAVAERKATRR